MTKQTSGLAGARTGSELVEAARAVIERSPYVSLDWDAPAWDDLVSLVARSGRADWSWYLSRKDLSLADAAFEYAFNAALNGGYFASEGGAVRQWESGGSGSAALVAWIEELRRDGAVPGIHVGPEEVDAVIAPRLAGIPHAQARLEICRQFADPGRRNAFEALIAACCGVDGSWRFDLDAADSLARTYPAGFGGDPFRKKAVLAFLMLAGWLGSRGERVEFLLPIPSDYQIPRILAWKGVIVTSPALEAELRARRLLDASGDAVTHLRAAAVVAARRLGAAAAKGDDVVDGALFTTFRKDEDFKANALPPARCDSMWF